MVFVELARRFIVHFMIFEYSVFVCFTVLFCCVLPVLIFFARSIGIGYSDCRIRIRRVWNVDIIRFVCQTGSGEESLSNGLVG